MDHKNTIDIRAQERAAREKAERDRTASLNEREDWRWLLSDARGRRIVRRLLDTCGVYRTSFTGNSHTFFNEGQRNVGLVLIDKVHRHAPEQYTVMMQESTEND
ncbi:Bbp19 family protein [Asticcacaulis solisilvae]|uniref:Bbp19 family protein n=1 Tax=Asticcacaulis solisilvae TaxID=1217274 RepID=UPI003FD74723